jgi:SOS-response transcriptional repressor LexA
MGKTTEFALVTGGLATVKRFVNEGNIYFLLPAFLT